MRALIRRLLGFLLRIFFRRLEVDGAPVQDGPLVLVLNHPNSLIDPALVLCLVPRDVSFLAKAPLFHLPVVGRIARGLRAIPVHRRQDPGSDMARNLETFTAARTVLESGGAIALFPEGISHDAPGLQPLRTGAARIVLGARLDRPVFVQPAAVFYTAKATFRSGALLRLGPAFPVEAVTAGPDGEPPAHAVRELTERMGAALGRLVLDADAPDALALVSEVERILHSAAQDGAAPPTLSDRLAVRQRLLDGYRYLAGADPTTLRRTARRVRRLDRLLRVFGTSPSLLRETGYRGGEIVRYGLASLVVLILTAPLAVPGLVLHWPAYRLTGWLGRRYTPRDTEDVIATTKLLAGSLVFPLTWIVAAGVTAVSWNGRAAGVVLVAAPLLGWVGLRFMERVGELVARSRALLFYLGGRSWYLRLARERDRVVREVIQLAEAVDR